MRLRQKIKLLKIHNQVQIKSLEFHSVHFLPTDESNHLNLVIWSWCKNSMIFLSDHCKFKYKHKRYFSNTA